MALKMEAMGWDGLQAYKHTGLHLCLLTTVGLCGIVLGVVQALGYGLGEVNFILVDKLG